MRAKYSATLAWILAPTAPALAPQSSATCSSTPTLPFLARDLHSFVSVQRAADEAVDAVDLEGRVGGVAREHVGGDDGMALHSSGFSQDESVASGLAKNRKGTKVVPSPGETSRHSPLRGRCPR